MKNKTKMLMQKVMQNKFVQTTAIATSLVASFAPSLTVDKNYDTRKQIMVEQHNQIEQDEKDIMESIDARFVLEYLDEKQNDLQLWLEDTVPFYQQTEQYVFGTEDKIDEFYADIWHGSDYRTAFEQPQTKKEVKKETKETTIYDILDEIDMTIKTNKQEYNKTLEFVDFMRRR